MEITIKGIEKEIAGLVLELQNRQKGIEKEVAGLVLELQNRQIVVTNVSKNPPGLTAGAIYEACRNHLTKEDK